jgi:hypothetical protein
MKPYKEGYLLYTTNLPFVFKSIFRKRDEVKITFLSPTPEGYEYIGRNHPFVEQLSQYILNNALIRNGERLVARSSVITTDKVSEKTSIFQLRVRNIISERAGGKQIVAEEMILWGYKGNLKEHLFISQTDAERLIEEAFPVEDISTQRQTVLINNEINELENLNFVLKDVVRERSEKLIAAHERFRKLMGGSAYKVVEPVLPPDILGIYVLIPKIK